MNIFNEWYKAEKAICFEPYTPKQRHAMLAAAEKYLLSRGFKRFSHIGSGKEGFVVGAYRDGKRLALRLSLKKPKRFKSRYMLRPDYSLSIDTPYAKMFIESMLRAKPTTDPHDVVAMALLVHAEGKKAWVDLDTSNIGVYKNKLVLVDPNGFRGGARREAITEVNLTMCILADERLRKDAAKLHDVHTYKRFVVLSNASQDIRDAFIESCNEHTISTFILPPLLGFPGVAYNQLVFAIDPKQILTGKDIFNVLLGHYEDRPNRPEAEEALTHKLAARAKTSGHHKH